MDVWMYFVLHTGVLHEKICFENIMVNYLTTELPEEVMIFITVQNTDAKSKQ